MNEEDLRRLGLPIDLNLEGQVSLIRIVENAPTIFLFDEIHNNLDSININIRNAFELIEKANIEIVGVESHSGGRNWNELENEYDDTRYPPNIWVNIKPNMYEEINNLYPGLAHGVESHGMLTKLGELIAKGQLNINDVGDHPLNQLRSRHFIITLFNLREELNFNKNAILNCGLNHNNHFEEMIRTCEIDEITNSEANYIRINTAN